MKKLRSGFFNNNYFRRSYLISQSFLSWKCSSRTFSLENSISIISNQNNRSFQTFKRIEMFSYGTPKESLRIQTVDSLPEPKDNEILVKVHASSLNVIDIWLRKGYGKKIFEGINPLPRVLGRDFSGEVTKVGPNVWNFKEGDQIFGATSPIDPHGFHSEYALVNEQYVAKKPLTLSHLESASIPFIGLTAHSALIDDANVKPGQSVLILGGSGTIGVFSIQLLKHMGCPVDVTCGLGSVSTVKEFGANEVFGYHDQTISKKYDIVFDCYGGENRYKAFELLNKGGHLVSVRGELISLIDERGIVLGLFSSVVELGSEKLVQKAGLDVNYDWSYVKANGKVLEKIAKLVNEGKILPFIDKNSFPLDQAIEAHEYYESGKGRGKVMITI